MAILYVGIDLAKRAFAVLGVNEAGKDERAGQRLRLRLSGEGEAMAFPCLTGGARTLPPGATITS